LANSSCAGSKEKSAFLRSCFSVASSSILSLNFFSFCGVDSDGDTAKPNVVVFLSSWTDVQIASTEGMIESRSRANEDEGVKNTHKHKRKTAAIASLTIAPSKFATLIPGHVKTDVFFSYYFQ